MGRELPKKICFDLIQFCMEISLENLYLIVRGYCGFSTVRTLGSCRLCRQFYVRTHVKFTRVNKLEAMYAHHPNTVLYLLSESLKQANVKVERGST